MMDLPVDFLPYVKYVTPPVIGAFIGYLTNRVAIKMLFRPLKAWRIAGIKVPMTPGVIPSKRADLAKNMGEVVGDHLLTSEEIGKGLQQEVFQKHLYHLIRERQTNILQNDLGTLPSIVPQKFQAYFDIASKTVSYRIKENIYKFIQSSDFLDLVESSLDDRLESFLDQEIGVLLSADEREISYAFIEKNLSRMFQSKAMEQWVQDFVHEKVSGILQHDKSLSEVLPETLQQLFLATIEKQTPALLEKLAEIVSEDEVRDKIVQGACVGVEKFIDSLGGMADMVRGFLRPDMVESKIREYLIEKNDAIVDWLRSEEVQDRVVVILRERSCDFLNKPISQIFKIEDESVIEDFCSQFSSQILNLLQEDDVVSTLSSMIKSNIEDNIESGALSLRHVLIDLFGREGMVSAKKWVKNETGRILQSQSSQKAIDSMMDVLFAALLQKKIGRLANLIPQGIQDGITVSLQKMTSNMLATEVPGLVQSLNIKRIVVERVNSLDLLRLERLLLSIMEEQFKYINLFGALLGFLIGCLNLIFLYGI